MASRDLRIVVSTDTRRGVRGLAQVATTADKTATRMDHLKRAASAAGLALAGGLAIGAKKAFDEFQEAERATAQTNAALKSTHGAAKVTAKEISNLANAISLKAGIDDEAIQSGENLLLTFTKIRNETGKGNDIFNQATQTITDMSVSLDQDLKSSAIQVGKALNDPVKGMTALQRVGVSFTDKQKERVAGWVAEGKQLKAQRFILRELTTEFGGSAAAQATSTDKMKVAFENLFESIGTAIGPTIERAAAATAKFVNQMQSGEGPGGRFAAKLKEIWNETKPIVQWVGRATVAVGKFADKHPGIAKVAVAVGLVATAYNKFKIGTAIRAVAAFTKAAAATPGQVRDALSGVKGVFTRVFSRAGTAGGETAAERAATGIMGSFPQKEGRMKTTTKNVMTRVGKAGGLAMAAGVIIGLAGLSAGIGKVLNKAKTNIIDPWVHRHFGKSGDVYSDVRDFIARNLPDTLPGAPLLHEIFGKGMGQPIIDFLGPLAITLGSKGAKSVDAFNPLAMKYGLTLTSGFRPGDDGWHGQNRARDYSNGYATPQELAFARFVANTYGGKLLELIHTPLGFGIKNGQRVPLSFWGSAINADHYDHVHVAMASGGTTTRKVRALVGEEGPEIVDLPVGAKVHPFSKSKQMISAAMAGLFPGFAGGGTVVNAARGAGFHGGLLRTMVAIARAESGWNPSAVGDGGNSIGLWQIYMPAHPWARGLNLRNPSVNARAAMRVYRSQGLGAWSVYNSGAYRSWLDEAAAAIQATSGGRHHRANHRGSAGGGDKPTATKGALANFDILRTRAENRLGRLRANNVDDDPATAANEYLESRLDDVGGLKKLRGYIKGRIGEIKRRLRKINRALRGRLRPRTRARLLNEKLALLQELGGLQGDIRDINAEIKEDTTAPASEAGDTGGGAADTSRADLVEAVRALKASIDAQNQFARSVAGIGQATALKAFSDVISGQIAGYGNQRARSAGDGVTGARY